MIAFHYEGEGGSADEWRLCNTNLSSSQLALVLLHFLPSSILGWLLLTIAVACYRLYFLTFLSAWHLGQTELLLLSYCLVHRQPNPPAFQIKEKRKKGRHPNIILNHNYTKMTILLTLAFIFSYVFWEIILKLPGHVQEMEMKIFPGSNLINAF